MKLVNLTSINLLQIQIFVKAAEYGSFNKAANDLNLSASMVSKKIAALEAETGLYLFIRKKNKVLLTPSGRELLSSWRRLLGLFNASLEDAHRVQSVQGYSLTFGLGSSVNANKFFVPLMRKYQETHGSFTPRVEMRPGFDLIRELITDYLDVIFLPLFMGETLERYAELKSKAIIICPLYAGMLPTNPLAKKESLAVSDLKTQRFVMPSHIEVPEYSQMMLELCKKAGFAPRIARYVENETATTLNINFDDEVFVPDEYFHEFNSSHFVYKKLEGTESGIIMTWKKEAKREVKRFANYALDYFTDLQNGNL